MAGWIFQANPRVFDIDRYLQTNGKELWWTVRQRHFQGEMRPGDIVFIWRADGGQPGSGGIVAKGEITGFPQERPDDAPELWLDGRKVGVALRVPFRVLEKRLGDRRIPRAWLMEDANFQDLRILRMRNETNYLLTDEQLSLLLELWESTKEMSSEVTNFEARDFPEGRLSLAIHLQRERNRELVKAARSSYKKQFGELRCTICDFSFRERYGTIGEDFIEMHHVVPISEASRARRSRVTDLVPVCANCHRMIHRRRPWLTVEALRELIRR